MFLWKRFKIFLVSSCKTLGTQRNLSQHGHFVRFFSTPTILKSSGYHQSYSGDLRRQSHSSGLLLLLMLLLLLLFSFFFIFDKYHYQNEQREIKEGFLPYTNLNWILQWWYCIFMLAYEDKDTRIRFCRDYLVLLCWFIEKETHVLDVMLIHGHRNTWIRLYSDYVDLLCWFIQEKNLEIDSKVMILYCYAGLYW